MSSPCSAVLSLSSMIRDGSSYGNLRLYHRNSITLLMTRVRTLTLTDTLLTYSLLSTAETGRTLSAKNSMILAKCIIPAKLRPEVLLKRLSAELSATEATRLPCFSPSMSSSTSKPPSLTTALPSIPLRTTTTTISLKSSGGRIRSTSSSPSSRQATLSQELLQALTRAASLSRRPPQKPCRALCQPLMRLPESRRTGKDRST